MTAHADSLEERLVIGYSAQERHYTDAARLLEDAVGAPTGDWAERLHSALRSAAEIDLAMAADKAAWRAAGRSPTGELKSLLDRIGIRLHQLGTCVDGQVASLLETRERLVPEIDEFVRRRAMLEAYEQNGPARHS